MTPTNLYKLAIVALQERVKKSAPVARLYLPQFGGARSPEVVRAWKAREKDLKAIEFFHGMILEESKTAERPAD